MPLYTSWDEGNFNTVSALSSQLKAHYILRYGIPVLNSLKLLGQSDHRKSEVGEHLLKGRAYPWATAKWYEFPYRRLSAMPPLRFEFLSIFTPDVFVVVQAPVVANNLEGKCPTSMFLAQRGAIRT